MYAGQVVESGPVRAILNRPAHPYTEALLGSVLKIHGKIARLESIEGQPPALWDLPRGCRSAARCRYAKARCRQENPPSFAVGDETFGHVASCWKLEDPTW